MPFVKLDTGILDSSIWSEDLETIVCWICMLAMADSTGLVGSTAPGISKRAGISLDATRQALETLESPDPDSKSLENEGRRIQRVDGGFFILNYEKYRLKDHTNAERQRRHRAREKERARNNVTLLHNALSNTPSASESASASESVIKKKGKSELDQLGEHVLTVLKIPMSDKAETEKLLNAFGLEYMKASVGRMAVYFEVVRENGWTKYVIGRHWRNLYEKLEYFSSDENLQRKLDEMKASRAQENKVDCRTVSGDFSADEELARRQRERWGIDGEAGNV